MAYYIVERQGGMSLQCAIFILEVHGFGLDSLVNLTNLDGFYEPFKVCRVELTKDSYNSSVRCMEIIAALNYGYLRRGYIVIWKVIASHRLECSFKILLFWSMRSQANSSSTNLYIIFVLQLNAVPKHKNGN